MKGSLFEFNMLFDFCCQVFEAKGLSAENAALASTVLLDADLKGIDSHGLARLGGYMRLSDKNRLNLKANFNIVHETPTTATVDADSGLGLLAAPFAMDLAIKKAEIYGCGFVCVNNSNHFGIAGYHSELAVQKNMIGFASTNASPLVAPTYSNERLLGTNPMAFSFPVKNRFPITADFATTTAANGKLEILQRKNEMAPSGWIQNKDGTPTHDPNTLSAGGSLLPLGSDPEHGSHKGFCLGAVVDLFSGVLSGANFGPWVPPFVSFLEPKQNLVGKGIGHFVGAWRVDAFGDLDSYYKNIAIWINTFKSAKTIDANKQVIIPGEPEHETKKIRLLQGIPLVPKVIDDLKILANQLEIKHPF